MVKCSITRPYKRSSTSGWIPSQIASRLEHPMSAGVGRNIILSVTDGDTKEKFDIRIDAIEFVQLMMATQ